MKIFFSFLLIILFPRLAFSQTTDSLAREDSLTLNNTALMKDTLPKNDTSAAKNILPSFQKDSQTEVFDKKLKDSSLAILRSEKDTAVKNGHSPRQATIRSLIIPGWGQIYNKKYWKLPIVYGAIGVPVYLFFDNKRWYSRTRYALSVVVNDRIENEDSMALVHPQLKALVTQKLEGSLINYRNEFRKNMDYSILVTLIMWGLNIVDATVDGHLKAFDVSDDLSLKIKPSFMTGTGAPGLSIVVNFK